MLADFEATEGGPSYGPGLASHKKTAAKKSVQKAKAVTKQKKIYKEGNIKTASLVLTLKAIYGLLMDIYINIFFFFIEVDFYNQYSYICNL